MDEQNSWKDLEALLGLPPQPAPGSRPTEKPAPRPHVVMPSIEPPQLEVSAAEPRDEGPGEAPERGRGRRRGGRRPDARRGRDEPVEEAAPTASVSDEPAEPAGDVAAEPSAESAEPVGNEEQGERSRGRRRRGRRSRRGGPDRPGDEPQATGAADDAPSGDDIVALPLADEPPGNDLEVSPEPVGADEGPERRPRRGRPRRRSRADDEPTPRSDAESPDVVAADVPRDDDDDSGPEDNLSDWSVPSWQELVDSLYRPDR